MKLIGLMLARNEDWVIGLSLRAALMWCDAVVVLMHNCTDETLTIVEAVISETDEVVKETHGGTFVNRRVVICGAHTFEWEEMNLRQNMLECARGFGATHIALIDADEVLTGNLLAHAGSVRMIIRDYIEKTPAGTILQLPWLQLTSVVDWPFGGVMSSGMWSQQNVSVAFADDRRYHWTAIEGYDHHHREPMGRELTRFQPDWLNAGHLRNAGLMHLQFLSRRRLLAKQFLYQLNDMKRWPNRKRASDVAAYYSRTVAEADAASVQGVPCSWWEPYKHLMPYLHIDDVPWQEAECKRLLAENPNLARGLNDFGLMKEWGLR